MAKYLIPLTLLLALFASFTFFDAAEAKRLGGGSGAACHLVEAGADVGGLRERQITHSLVDLGQGDQCVVGADVDPEVDGASNLGPDTGRRDERLGRDAVPQHAGTADPVRIDHRDVGPVGGRRERRLVTRGSAADDDDPGHCDSCSPRRLAASFVVIDGYDFGPSWGAHLRRHGLPVTAMVDGRFGADQDADLSAAVPGLLLDKVAGTRR